MAKKQSISVSNPANNNPEPIIIKPGDNVVVKPAPVVKVVQPPSEATTQSSQSVPVVPAPDTPITPKEKSAVKAEPDIEPDQIIIHPTNQQLTIPVADVSVGSLLQPETKAVVGNVADSATNKSTEVVHSPVIQKVKSIKKTHHIAFIDKIKLEKLDMRKALVAVAIVVVVIVITLILTGSHSPASNTSISGFSKQSFTNEGFTYSFDFYKDANQISVGGENYLKAKVQNGNYINLVATTGSDGTCLNQQPSLHNPYSLKFDGISYPICIDSLGDVIYYDVEYKGSWHNIYVYSSNNTIPIPAAIYSPILESLSIQ